MNNGVLSGLLRFVVFLLLLATLFSSLNLGAGQLYLSSLLSGIKNANIQQIDSSFCFAIQANTGLSGIDSFLNGLLMPLQYILYFLVSIADAFYVLFQLTRILFF